MLPRVTVIIANYNYDKYISDAIQSAIDQDYEGPLSICIVDDGSTDNSWKEISKFFSDTAEPEYINDMKVMRGVAGKIDLVGLKTRNGGASVARNTGIDFCMEETDVYAILDADDIYYPNKISICINKLVEDDRVGVVYADYAILNTATDAIYYESKLPYNKRVLEKECIVHSGALITKTVFQEIKEDGYYYDPSLHGPASQGFIGCSEDYDLWIRISEKFMIVHIPQELALAREGDQNQTRNVTQEIFTENWKKIWDKKQARINAGSPQ
jgi:glycosyltransferase involved in cell wall biosynthesis